MGLAPSGGAVSMLRYYTPSAIKSQCSPWHHEPHHAARQMANRQRPIVCFKLSRMGEMGRCFREGFARLA